MLRVILGLYLLAHFVTLVPYGAEVFSSAGWLPGARLSPIAGLFPNVFLLWDGPAVIVGALLAGAGLSIALAAGVGDRVAAVALWYLWACLFGRNPLIANPSIPYVGWLLLAHALVAPSRGDGPGWRLSPAVTQAAWAVLAVGYTYSGATKLASLSWLDGTALHHVVSGPLSRPGVLRDLVLAAPAPLLMALTWGTLLLELLYAPLGLSRRLRPWLWAGMVGMHVGIIALIDFADLSAAMLVAHLFAFDPAWLPERVRARLAALETASASTSTSTNEPTPARTGAAVR